MPSSTLVDPYFSQTFCPPPGADPDGAACAAGATAGAPACAPLAVAAPDDAEGTLDPPGALEGALVAVAEPVAGMELPAAGDDGGTGPEEPGTDVLGEPAVVAVAAAWDGDPAAEPDGDPVALCGAVVGNGAAPVEEAD